MSARSIFIGLAFATFAALPARAGNDVGNGGDAVQCTRAANSRFDGYYAADYLMTLGPADAPLTPDAQVRSIDQSLRRIQSQLDRLYPELGTLFAGHVAELKNFTDWTRSRIWTPAAHGLVEVKDERVVRRLPPNCGAGGAPGTAKLIQAVIRQAKPRILQYQVDFGTLRDLEAQSLQLSYLLVHEWLWDFTEDPEAIRWANRLLHSASLEQMDTAAFQANFAGTGILLQNYGYDRFCTRTDLIRATLEHLTGQPCDLFTREQILALNPMGRGNPDNPYFVLSLEKANLEGLRFGDFSSLAHLRSLDLSGNRLRGVVGEHFAGLNALEAILLAGNGLTEVPPRLFDVLPQLREAHLTSNAIETLPAGMLRNAFNLGNLVLSGNRIREVPVDLMVTRRNGGLSVNLRGNAITALPKGFFDSIPREVATTQRFALHLGENPIPPAERERIQKEAAGRPIHVNF